MEVMDVVNPRSGQDDKTRWNKCGVAFIKEGKSTRILLDTIPLPDPKTGDCVLVLMERKKDGVPQKND